jgi:hypothetical protein
MPIERGHATAITLDMNKDQYTYFDPNFGRFELNGLANFKQWIEEVMLPYYLDNLVGISRVTDIVFTPISFNNENEWDAEMKSIQTRQLDLWKSDADAELAAEIKRYMLDITGKNGFEYSDLLKR